MNIIELIQGGIQKALMALYEAEIPHSKIIVNSTRKEFEGDYTVVTFPFAKAARKKPDAIAEELGEYLVKEMKEIDGYNVIKGFLNLVVSESFWIDFLQEAFKTPDFGQHQANGKKVLVEFSSPNTNKPLHLGHIRNILLGWSTSKILEAAGYEVARVQIVNDRGIAICKSMLAWQQFGEGTTPESTNTKGDHFVGKYYVLFEKKFKAEYKAWQATPDGTSLFENWASDELTVKKAEKAIAEAKRKAIKKADEAKHKAIRETEETAQKAIKGIEASDEKAIAEVQSAKQQAIEEAEATRENAINEKDFTLTAYFFKEVFKNTYFNEYSPLGKAAKAMLLKWEAGDAETIALWQQMNNWVYKGFEATYKKMGVHFDKLYYESDTYLLGKDVIAKGLAEGIFYEKEDNSVWIDLTKEKLDHKLVLRSDGTSVYITQDIGTAEVRYKDFGVDKMVYVVADEQNYHFQVLFKTLERMGAPYASGLHHLSYGMVDLPSGKMKSREGTVVDADDLIEEVVAEARKNSQERDTLSALSEEEQAEIMYKIGLGALKFFIIKVNPQKRMTFNPAESVDMQGHTGPYVQNAYVRVRALLRKAGEQDLSQGKAYTELKALEKEILNLLYAFPELIATAAEDYDPSAIANYSYELAKNYHRLWHDLPILKAESEAAKAFRLQLSQVLANVLKFSMEMLGIEMPDRM